MTTGTIPFGFWLIERSHPDLAFDLEQLPEKLQEKGEFDQIARELESMGSGSALTIRTHALRSLGELMRSSNTNAGDALEWLANQHRRLAAWAACACARVTLTSIFDSRRDTAEGFLRIAEDSYSGRATQEELMQALMKIVEYSSAVAVDGYSAEIYAVNAISNAVMATADSLSLYNKRLFSEVRTVGAESARALSEFVSLGSDSGDHVPKLMNAILDALPGFPEPR